MAKARNVKKCFFTLNTSPLFHLFSMFPFTWLVFSPKRSPRSHHKIFTLQGCTIFFLSLFLTFTFLAFSILNFIQTYQDPAPCSLISPYASFSVPSGNARLLASFASTNSYNEDDEPSLAESVMVPLPAQVVAGNLSDIEREFWQQPDGRGYKPCLDFSIAYRRKSAKITKESKKFLVVVASGGLNQQRNQIVDAVVIARILEAALVVPVLQVNLIWGDESEFADLFDVKHLKKTLKADVRVVSSLPSTHLKSRQSIESQLPYNISPSWIRARFFKQLSEEGVLVLKGLDSKLSKNLPPDLQKLRCKVAFHALRFVAPIQELGNRLAKRMWIEGPYIALHLRLEKDVWVRTGCLTGLGPEYDEIIAKIRDSELRYLTGKLNMSYIQRRLAGLCPLNAAEMARFLKALGAPGSARVYIAGGEPFGGPLALEPLAAEFPNLVTKELLAREGELSPYINRSSALAAFDYIVALNSNVFVPSHGGNMGRAMQGHRAYVGHRKYIKPNKQAMLPFFENSSISEEEFGSIIRKLHRKSQGHPEPRNNKRDRDVTSYPVPECVRKHGTGIFSTI